MNIAIWVGFLSALGILGYGITEAGATGALFNLHGIMVVLGGTGAAMLINCSFRDLVSAFRRAGALFLPSAMPTMEETATEVVRLAKKAHAEGGLLSLQGESREMMGGFVHRAITVAISAGETAETRRILDTEIKSYRVVSNEDANVFRTIAVLSPMFGLLGTLMGMIRVLSTMASDPTKVGPAMALALSSAFLGITIANFICVPVAGQIRLKSMAEMAVMNLVLEGILDIAAGKTPYLIELHMAAYVEQKRAEMEAIEAGGAPRAAVGAGAP